VVCGFYQRNDIDYDETLGHTIKPAMIRVVLIIAASQAWSIHQLDMKNMLFHGHHDKTIYC